MKSFTDFVKQVGERKQASYENSKQGWIQVVHENVHPSSTYVSYVRNPAKKNIIEENLSFILCSLLFFIHMFYYIFIKIYSYNSSDSLYNKTLPFHFQTKLKSLIIYASHLKRKRFVISLIYEANSHK